MFFKRAKQGKSKSGAAETAAAQPEASAAAPPPDAQASLNGSSSPLAEPRCQGARPQDARLRDDRGHRAWGWPRWPGARAECAHLWRRHERSRLQHPRHRERRAPATRRPCAPSCNRLPGSRKKPADWVYVSSFDSTGGFRALKLPAGTAKAFADGMAQVIDRLADALPAAFTADDYELKRRTIEEEFRFSREDALETLRREAETQNIALLRTPSGIAVAPILEGKVVKTDVFNSVPEVAAPRGRDQDRRARIGDRSRCSPSAPASRRRAATACWPSTSRSPGARCAR